MGIGFLGATWINFASKSTSSYQRDKNEQIGNPSKRVNLDYKIENIRPPVKVWINSEVSSPPSPERFPV